MRSTNSPRCRTWNGRVEDDALLRGTGRFGDDVKPDGALAAAFVRSPHGLRQDRQHRYVAAAKSAQGVVGVFTGADLAAAHYHSVSHPHPIPVRSGQADLRAGSPGARATSVVRACRRAGRDGRGADRRGRRTTPPRCVAVEYDELEAVIDMTKAVTPGAPQLWPEAPNNIAFDWTAPADPDGKNKAAIDKIFTEAAHVVKVELVNQRLVVASIEPRTATASYDAGEQCYTLRIGTQGVAGMRMGMAGIMNIKPERVARADRRCRRRLRHEGVDLLEYAAMLHAAKALGESRSIGYRRARKPSSPTIRAATRSGPRSLRSIRAAVSWRCASTASATWAPTSPASRISCRPCTSPAACRRSTTFRRRRCGRAASSPTRCRPGRIVAPAARRRAICSSG